MKQLYINGKQATLWQKVLFSIAMIGFLCLLIPLGLGILAVGFVFAVGFYLYIYFKIRKVKKMMQDHGEEVYQQTAQTAQTMNKMREDVIDGEYKEL